MIHQVGTASPWCYLCAVTLTLAGGVNVGQSKSTHPQEPQRHGHTGREEWGRYSSSHDRRAWKVSSRSKSEELFVAGGRAWAGWLMDALQHILTMKECIREKPSGGENRDRPGTTDNNWAIAIAAKLPSICCYHGDSRVQSERVGGDVSGVFVSKRALRVLNPELASSNDGHWPIKVLIFLFTEKGAWRGRARVVFQTLY